MKARHYLSRIYFIEEKIRELKNHVLFLKEQAEKRTSNLSPDKVQASGSASKQADAICRWVDIEKEIEVEEAKLQDILNTIESLRPNESAVLYQHYRFDKSLKEIASDMHRSYSWVTKVHTDGVRSVQKILDERKVRT